MDSKYKRDDRADILKLISSFKYLRATSYTSSHDLLTISLHNGPDQDNYMRYELRFIICSKINITPVIHIESPNIIIDDNKIDDFSAITFSNNGCDIICCEISIFDTLDVEEKIFAVIP